MLRSIKDLHGYALHAKDGVMGEVHGFLFDGQTWHVRYMVADTGDWLPGRLVLIAPNALGRPDWEEHWLPVQLAREEIKNSPDIERHKPVSRRQEVMIHNYYGWPYYWTAEEEEGESEAEAAEPAAGEGEPNLRSTREVIGYHIKATDGEVGHVDDFIADDLAWIIRYMVVDTRNWLPGRKVLIAPTLVEGIEWRPGQVAVNLPRESIRKSPEFDPSAPVNREYEVRLYDYYGRPKYWS